MVQLSDCRGFYHRCHHYHGPPGSWYKGQALPRWKKKKEERKVIVMNESTQPSGDDYPDGIWNENAYKLYSYIIGRKVSKNFGGWVSDKEADTFKRFKRLCKQNQFRLCPDVWDFMFRNMMKILEPALKEAEQLGIPESERLAFIENRFDKIAYILANRDNNPLFDQIDQARHASLSKTDESIISFRHSSSKQL